MSKHSTCQICKSTLALRKQEFPLFPRSHGDKSRATDVALLWDRYLCDCGTRIIDQIICGSTYETRVGCSAVNPAVHVSIHVECECGWLYCQSKLLETIAINAVV